MMALHISGNVKLWAGDPGGALAPVLDELHGSPSSLLPEVGQNSLSGEEIIAPVITGGMATENVPYDTLKIPVIQIFLDRQK